MLEVLEQACTICLPIHGYYVSNVPVFNKIAYETFWVAENIPQTIHGNI